MAQMPEEQAFLSGLRARLLQAELFASEELRDLGKSLAKLQEENDALRQQLSGGAPLKQEDSTQRSSSKPTLGNSLRALRALQRSEMEEDRVRSIKAMAMVVDEDGVVRRGSCRSRGSEYASELSMGVGSVLSASEDGASYTSVEVRDILLRRALPLPRGRFYKQNGMAQYVVRTSWFQHGTLLLVLLNALWLGVELDINGRSLHDSPPVFQAVHHAFVVLFTLEASLRFAAYERKKDVFMDAWFLFDAVLALSMIAETWVVGVALLWTRGGGGAAPAVNLSALRNFRLLRVARVAQLARFFPELQTMANSMLAGLRSVGMMVVVLLILTYGVAILMRTLGGDTEWGEAHFSSVPQSVYSLIIFTVVPEHAKLLARIGVESWYCTIIYFVFVLLTVILLMNMLVAFLCDVIFRESSSQKDQRCLEIMSDKLMSTFQSIGLNSDDLLSKAKFTEILTNETALDILSDVGVDVVALADEAELIFGEHRQPVMSFESFKEEVLKFRTTNVATLGSITATRRFVRAGLSEIDRKIDQLVAALISGNKGSSPSLLRAATSSLPAEASPTLRHVQVESTTSLPPTPSASPRAVRQAL